ncbi:MAG TPA: 7,8-didemethyl-8-hydroxy-5-deazariboflavin synthase CofG, partial [Acidimicrobiia bacterium]|nr:7,8-didemethyl-8-hydroxy-5-deazariboflavin synthase CofG [Acidimicrobiia bacterium]
MTHPAPDPDLALRYLEGAVDDSALFAHARLLRDEGRGQVVTYSRKVFIPLTTLCRDRCTYCTFAKPPGAGGMYLEPDEVLAIARAGDESACTEALFTLGDRPEERWPQAASFLAARGLGSTIDYVAEMSALVRTETSLFPHANPGLLDVDELRKLRSTNPSMGMMLENISPRLMEPGMPHHGTLSKDPARRVATIEAAGRAKVPFTTGILVGIGETRGEIVDSLFALQELGHATGAIQEVIIQNFRAKADTPMRHSAEPVPRWFARVVALARWIMGAEANVQVPPNLTEQFEIYLEAGINDWGGVSPLTIDWVNPEAPWPHLDELRGRTEGAGFTLRPRLPVYPEYIDEDWIDAALYADVVAAADKDGLALIPETSGA